MFQSSKFSVCILAKYYKLKINVSRYKNSMYFLEVYCKFEHDLIIDKTYARDVCCIYVKCKYADVFFYNDENYRLVYISRLIHKIKIHKSEF